MRRDLHKLLGMIDPRTPSCRPNEIGVEAETSGTVFWH